MFCRIAARTPEANIVKLVQKGIMVIPIKNVFLVPVQKRTRTLPGDAIFQSQAFRVTVKKATRVHCVTDAPKVSLAIHKRRMDFVKVATVTLKVSCLMSAMN